MTDDATLRERVARAIEQSLLTSQLRDAFEHPYLAEADAALAAARPVIRSVALEEAAKELDKWGDIYGDNAARAIRALAAQPAPGGKDE